MGLLDRFKKERPSRPDACTIEALARLRARPDVPQVDVVDADTLAVTWEPEAGTSGTGPQEVSLRDLRPRWAEASGFERITLMDEWVEGVRSPTSSPDASALAPIPGVDDAADTPVADTPVADTPVADRLVVVVGRGRADGGAAWAVTDHLQAHLALDHAHGLAVTQAELDGWGVDLDTARGWAVTNLAGQGPGLDPVGEGTAAWVVTTPEHRASWLCAPDQLLGAAGLAEAVVVVPTPGELVVVDPADDDLVLSILENTLVILDQESDLCWPAPLLVRAHGGPGQVGEWQPPQEHPAASLALELTQRSAELA